MLINKFSNLLILVVKFDELIQFSWLKGFAFGFLPYKIVDKDNHIFTTTLIKKPLIAPQELAKGTNIPNEITPNRGPPRMPNMLKLICKTVAPTYSQRNDNPMVNNPKHAAYKRKLRIYYYLLKILSFTIKIIPNNFE